MDSIETLLKKLGIKKPNKDQIKILKAEIDRAQEDIVLEALKMERSRCYEYILYCRDTWFEHKEDLPQDIVVAAEAIMEGIQKGLHVKT